jgi:hypothetical protein
MEAYQGRQRLPVPCSDKKELILPFLSLCAGITPCIQLCVLNAFYINSFGKGYKVCSVILTTKDIEILRETCNAETVYYLKSKIPAAFKDDRSIQLMLMSKDCSEFRFLRQKGTCDQIMGALGGDAEAIQVRSSFSERYDRKCFYLSSSYEWSLERDGDSTVLVPRRWV